MAIVTINISRKLAETLADELEYQSNVADNSNGYLFDSIKLVFNVDDDDEVLTSCGVHPKCDGFELSAE